ncbi:MAG: UvrD-helicase domain-containing protein, partial [Oscillospiraceae bacterium]|nr:UvrD-helicase domain-containing protein [Oscillospiraceae bacterium]
SERLRADPKNRRLRRQTVLAHRAEIGTIHSFCGGLARENAHALGISPDFRVAEESECETVKNAVAERVLEARYERINEYEGFSELVDTVSPGRDDRRLMELTLELYGKLRSHYDEKRWIEEQLIRLRLGAESDVSETVWGGLILKKARRIAEYWRGGAASMLERLQDDEEAYRLFGTCFEYALAASEAFLISARLGWDGAAEAASFDFPRAKPSKSGMYTDIKAEWERCRAGLRELPALFPAQSRELASDIDAVYPVASALLRLVSDFSEAYREEKRRRRIADFSDLEHFALKLLCDAETGAPTALAEEISGRYFEIMVDEYQDASAIQERIFAAVSRGGRNLVTVGDVRQSIYRFRLADPSIFLEKYRTFGDGDASDAPGRRVILSRNFRSREAIIDAVNYVFSLVMSEEFGELDYTEREYLTPGPERDGGSPVELDIITSEDLPDAAEDEEARNRPDKREYEARFIAERIRELVESGFMLPDGEGERRADYSDVVILLRTRKYAGLYRAALRRLGIPVEAPEAESFFDRPEVETALALLTVVDNPRDDIALIAALRSRVYAFTPDELANIRQSEPEGDFYDALVKYAESDDKAKNFLSELGELRALAPELGAERTLWLLYNRTELLALFASEEDGAVRRAGLMRLTQQARFAASVGRPAVFDFLLYVKKLRELGAAGSAEASADAEGYGAVRIMTAHKSKGLEFPIVFLADMSKRFNFADSRERLLFHRELGVGPKRVDLERRIEYPTLPRFAIAGKLADEMMSEELRVLYVAMTRAREKLIITYAASEAQHILERLAQLSPSGGEPVSPYILSRQKSIGDILLLAALTRPETRALLQNTDSAVEPAPRPRPQTRTPCDSTFERSRDSFAASGITRTPCDSTFERSRDSFAASDITRTPCDSTYNSSPWDVRLTRVGAETTADSADTIGGEEYGLTPAAEPEAETLPAPIIYAYPKAPELPSKLTVTELKNRAKYAEAGEDAEAAPALAAFSGISYLAERTHARPIFMAAETAKPAALTGAERGTALHLAMRRIELRKYADADELLRELDALETAGYLDARQRESIDANKILGFLRSEYGKRAVA